jgi:hypothetical protein
VPENSTLGLTRRGLETGPWRTYAGMKLETADTAKGSLPEPRQSSTLLLGGRWKRRHHSKPGSRHCPTRLRPTLARG